MNQTSNNIQPIKLSSDVAIYQINKVYYVCHFEERKGFKQASFLGLQNCAINTVTTDLTRALYRFQKLLNTNLNNNQIKKNK